MLETNKIGLFYGSSTCYTEMAAEKIQAAIGLERVDLFNIADIDIKHCQHYRFLIMGIPTWDYGELQEDWEQVWPQLEALDLQGHCVALFGLGDQIGYPQWFQDALGYLHDRLLLQGATLVGYWPSAHYRFEESKALSSDQNYFVGLALDEENEFELSDARIEVWVAQVLQAFEEFAQGG